MNLQHSAHNTAAALRYHLRIVRGEQLVLPAALWTLFVVMIVMFSREPERRYDLAAAYLGMMVPLAAGMLAAGTIVDDPVLELQLASPRSAGQLFVERLLLVLGIAAVTAVLFQGVCAVLGIPLDSLGGWPGRQLAWCVPTLALGTLSGLVALATRQSTGGALVCGFVWLLHVIIREGISATPVGRYVYLFMGARQPAHPGLVANQLSLLALAVVFAALGICLLRREERYL